VGLLSPETSNEGRVNGFREGLKELGYIEGQNIQVEYRWANGAYDRLHEFAVELVSRNVDVIVAYVTQASIEAKKATPKIPIVMVGVADPVAAGLVTSLAHPGGNVTGTSSIAADLVGKQIELLREIVPKISRISALWNPANVVFQQIQLRQVEAARQASGIDIQLVEARSPNDFTSAFATIRKEGTDALIILGEPVFESNFATLASLALEDRMLNRLQSSFNRERDEERNRVTRAFYFLFSTAQRQVGVDKTMNWHLDPKLFRATKLAIGKLLDHFEQEGKKVKLSAREAQSAEAAADTAVQTVLGAFYASPLTLTFFKEWTKVEEMVLDPSAKRDFRKWRDTQDGWEQVWRVLGTEHRS